MAARFSASAKADLDPHSRGEICDLKEGVGWPFAPIRRAGGGYSGSEAARSTNRPWLYRPTMRRRRDRIAAIWWSLVSEAEGLRRGWLIR